MAGELVYRVFERCFLGFMCFGTGKVSDEEDPLLGGWSEKHGLEHKGCQEGPLGMEELMEILKLERGWGSIVDYSDEPRIPLPRQIEIDLRKESSSTGAQQALILFSCLEAALESMDKNDIAPGRLKASLDGGSHISIDYQGDKKSLRGVADVLIEYESSSGDVSTGLVISGLDKDDEPDDLAHGNREWRVDCVLNMASMLRDKKNEAAVVYGVAIERDDSLSVLKLTYPGKLIEYRSPEKGASGWGRINDQEGFYAFSRALIRQAFGAAKTATGVGGHGEFGMGVPQNE